MFASPHRVTGMVVWLIWCYALLAVTATLALQVSECVLASEDGSQAPAPASTAPDQFSRIRAQFWDIGGAALLDQQSQRHGSVGERVRRACAVHVTCMCRAAALDGAHAVHATLGRRLACTGSRH